MTGSNYEFASPEITALSDLVENTALRSAIRKVPIEIWKLSDEALQRLAKPTSTALILKERFWAEYFKNLGSVRRFKLFTVYDEVCSYTHFYNAILRDPARLAWLLRLPTNLEERLGIYLSMAMNRAWDLLKHPAINSDGKMDHRVAKIHLRLFERLSTLRASQDIREK